MDGFNWEALSERCVEALVRAQEEAMFLGSPEVGTDHVLVGLLGGANLGAQLLTEHGVDLCAVRATLGMFREVGTPPRLRQFSWRVGQALSIAAQFARGSGSPFLNTDHLYLALLEQPDSRAFRILEQLKVPVELLMRRLRGPVETAGSGALITDLLKQLPVAQPSSPSDRLTRLPWALTLDRFLEVLDELSRALQTAHRVVAAACPHAPVVLDIPEVDDSFWPVVDEEVYQIAGLVNRLLTHMLICGAERLIFTPTDQALRVAYEMPTGRTETLDVPPILSTVIPFKVMRMALLNPMEKGREMEGEMALRHAGREHALRVRSEPVLRGLQVEVSARIER